MMIPSRSARTRSAGSPTRRAAAGRRGAFRVTSPSQAAAVCVRLGLRVRVGALAAKAAAAAPSGGAATRARGRGRAARLRIGPRNHPSHPSPGPPRLPVIHCHGRLDGHRLGNFLVLHFVNWNLPVKNSSSRRPNGPPRHRCVRPVCPDPAQAPCPGPRPSPGPGGPGRRRQPESLARPGWDAAALRPWAP